MFSLAADSMLLVPLAIITITLDSLTHEFLLDSSFCWIVSGKFQLFLTKLSDEAFEVIEIKMLRYDTSIFEVIISDK